MLRVPERNEKSRMLERTCAITADIFGVPAEQVGPQSSPDTIETWDSINHLNLVLALEQEFGIQFTPEEIEQLLSVELIVALLAEKVPVVEKVMVENV
jgi:acyl carrier protein